MRSTRVLGFVLAVSCFGAWKYYSSAEPAPSLKQSNRSTAANESNDSTVLVAVNPRVVEHPSAQSMARAAPVEAAAAAVAPIKPPVVEPLSESEKAAIVERVLIEVYPESATQRFDEELERQPVNHTWSAEVTVAAKRMLRTDALQGTQLSSVDCRQTICRMLVSHRDIEAEKAFWHSRFTADGPWSGNLQGGPSRSGDMFESFIYFANEGGVQQFAQIDALITEDTEFAVTQALAERGISADSG